MTKLELVLAGAALLTLSTTPACHSDGNNPESSSSSHWFTCHARSDCSGAPNAAACSGGYCVDDAGARIRRQSTEPVEARGSAREQDTDAASEPSAQDDAAGAAPDAETSDAPSPDARVDGSPAAEAAVSGPVDAGLAEAAEPQAAIKRLRVTANSFTQYSSVIPVAFNDAEGALLGEMYTTGAGGELETDIAASSVTLDRNFDSGHGWLLTYFGVESGDNLLTFGSSPQFGSPPPPVYSATLPAPQRSGATVVVRGGCGICSPAGSGSGLDAITLADPGRCLRDQGDNALVAWVEGATSLANFEGFTWRKGLSKPLAPAVQSVIFMAYQPASPCTIRMSDMLPGFSVQSALIMWSGATCVDTPQLGDSHAYAAGFAEDLEARVLVEGHVLRKRVAPAASIEFDRATLLPAPSAVRVTILDNPTRIHVSWVMPQDVRLDAASLELRFNFRDWTIVLPPDVRSVTLPVLPRDVDVADSELPNAKVYRLSYLASDSVDGYAALRNAPPNYAEPFLDRPLTVRGSSDVVMWVNPQR